MENININSLIVYIGIGAIIVELLLGVATGFDLLLIGVIFIISGILGTITNSFTTTLISIILLSVLYAFFGRTFIRQKFDIKTKETSVNNLIGKRGVVTKTISPKEAGQIKIEGEIWRAEADSNIDKNTQVTVHSVSGVTLKVS